MQELAVERKPLVYTDESMISSKLFPSLEYCVKGKNVEADQAKINKPALAFIVALNMEKGFFHSSTHKRSVNKESFLQFVKEIKEKMGPAPFALYLDNASFHKATIVREYMAANDIEAIWSPVYRPYEQASEYLIALIKQRMKKLIYSNLHKGITESYSTTFQKVVQGIEKQKV